VHELRVKNLVCPVSSNKHCAIKGQRASEESCGLSDPRWMCSAAAAEYQLFKVLAAAGDWLASAHMATQQAFDDRTVGRVLLKVSPSGFGPISLLAID
jgi:hypothetical protein